MRNPVKSLNWLPVVCCCSLFYRLWTHSKYTLWHNIFASILNYYGSATAIKPEKNETEREKMKTTNWWSHKAFCSYASTTHPSAERQAQPRGYVQSNVVLHKHRTGILCLAHGGNSFAKLLIVADAISCACAIPSAMHLLALIYILALFTNKIYIFTFSVRAPF